MISAERHGENITLGFRPAGKRLFRSVNREITSCRPKAAEQKMLCHRRVSSTGAGVGLIKTGLLARCFPWKNRVFRIHGGGEEEVTCLPGDLTAAPPRLGPGGFSRGDGSRSLRVQPGQRRQRERIRPPLVSKRPAIRSPVENNIYSADKTSQGGPEHVYSRVHRAE